jgi:tRNA(fMet)-specific endonuclease VapC
MLKRQNPKIVLDVLHVYGQSPEKIETHPDLMLYVFDTDHLTLYQRSHPILAERIRDLAYDTDQLATTIINYQEQISGRFEQVRRANDSAEIVKAYDRLKNASLFFEDWEILAYTDRAEKCFKASKKAGVRIGTLDLRISAIALSLDATVITRNRKDFQQVPNLKFEDWSVE